VSYKVELDASEIAFIKACIAGTVRRAQETMEERKAVDVTVAAAGVVTRLNLANINTRDVMFINTCLGETHRYLQNDRQLPRSQRQEAIAACRILINKLSGVGVERALIDP
jgi:hypothetical protein